MKKQILLLLALHTEDQKIQELQINLEKLAPELAEQEALVKAQQAAFDEFSARLVDLEKSKRSKEVEVETAEARLKDFQTKLSIIKTNKEYQAALKEIADTKKINKTIEDQILELMKQIDTLKADRQGVEEGLKGATEVFEKKKQAFETETASLRGEIEKWRAERDKIAAQIQPPLISQYQRVRKSGKEGMAEVSGGTCQGCYMRVPAQLYIELQKLTVIHYCPSCHRILYLADWVAPKEGSPKAELPKEELPKELKDHKEVSV